MENQIVKSFVDRGLILGYMQGIMMLNRESQKLIGQIYNHFNNFVRVVSNEIKKIVSMVMSMLKFNLLQTTINCLNRVAKEVLAMFEVYFKNIPIDTLVTTVEKVTSTIISETWYYIGEFWISPEPPGKHCKLADPRFYYKYGYRLARLLISSRLLPIGLSIAIVNTMIISYLSLINANIEAKVMSYFLSMSDAEESPFINPPPNEILVYSKEIPKVYEAVNKIIDVLNEITSKFGGDDIPIYPGPQLVITSYKISCPDYIGWYEKLYGAKMPEILMDSLKSFINTLLP